MPNEKKTREEIGVTFTWFCGGALALNILGIVGLLILIASNGIGHFWQKEIVQVRMTDGSAYMGEVMVRERNPAQEGEDPLSTGYRKNLKIGNRDLTGADFKWIDERQSAEVTRPEWAVMLERLEWGNFYGTMSELKRGDETVASGPEAVWKAFGPAHEKARDLYAKVKRIEKKEIGEVNYETERLRLEERRLAADRGLSDAERERRMADIAARRQAANERFEELNKSLVSLRAELKADTIVMLTASGQKKEIPVGNIVRAVPANQLSVMGKAGLYLARIHEFIWDDPRESNTEGGIFPAIFGTVMMVFIMSFAVVPFGVIAAVYLREYATQGPLVRMVNIAVNNLAGVPSIVFGIFGLGFFVYGIGGSIDRIFFAESLPTPTYGTGGILWASLTLALLTLPVVIVATEEGLAAVPRIVREGSLALGATKFETIWRVVLPASAPAILTGMILAMARAAGEVAPLMIVGMVKLAPSLPIDAHAPFVHFERKFMHLGFHIYDVGFQSPNVEATKPLVFATTLLLIFIVTAMNITAITVRNRLRAKYASSAV